MSSNGIPKKYFVKFSGRYLIDGNDFCNVAEIHSSKPIELQEGDFIYIDGYAYDVVEVNESDGFDQDSKIYRTRLINRERANRLLITLTENVKNNEELKCPKGGFY